MSITFNDTNSNNIFTQSFNKSNKSVLELETNIKSISTALSEVDTEIARTDKMMGMLTKHFMRNPTVTFDMYDNIRNKLSKSMDEKKQKQSILSANLQKQTYAKNSYIKSENTKTENAASLPKYAQVKAAAFNSFSFVDQAAKQAIGFESAMLGVRQAVNFETPAQFKAMGQDIIALSNRLPIAANELTAVVTTGAKSGVARTELLGFAESAGKMGLAFNISAQQAAGMMGQWRSAFSMNQAQANDLADKINYLGRTTTISSAQISEIVSSVGSLGAVGAGVSGEIAALGASMSALSVTPQVAANGIKGMVGALTAGSQCSQQQAAAFAQLGLNASEMAQRMQTDAKGGIMQVLTALQGMDQGSQRQIIQNLFGADATNAIMPLVSNLQLLQGNLDKVSGSSQHAGSVQVAFADNMNTTQAKLQMAQNSFANFGLTIGTALLPTISWLAEAFTTSFDKLTAFSNEFPALSSVITFAGAALLAGSAAIFGVQYAVSTFMLPFRTLITMYRGYQVWLLSTNGLKMTAAIASSRQAVATGICTAAQWALNAAIGASALAIAGFLISIGLIVAAGVWLYNNWDTVSAWFATLWDNPQLALEQFVDGIKNRFGGTLDWIAEKWNWIKNIFTNPINVQVSGNSGGSEIPQYAYGGRIPSKTLAWFAERGPEYAIPMDGSARSMGLWASAGQELGILADTSSNSGNSKINLQYSPTLNISGNADPQELQAVLTKQKYEFEQMLQEFFAQKERVSYT